MAKRPTLTSIKSSLKLHDSRIAHPAPTVRDYSAKRVDPFYATLPWIRCREAVLAARGRVCETCRAQDGRRVLVDHIHERKDGGAPFDPLNLRVQCWSCHARKTHRVKAERDTPPTATNPISEQNRNDINPMGHGSVSASEDVTQNPSEWADLTQL